MKRKQFKQSVKGAVSSVVIMPTFGNISFTVRGKFDLPFDLLEKIRRKHPMQRYLEILNIQNLLET